MYIIKLIIIIYILFFFFPFFLFFIYKEKLDKIVNKIIIYLIIKFYINNN